MAKKLCFIVLLIGLFWKNTLASVQAVVIISEVYPAPAAGEQEWVELYNQASTSADLMNWTLSDTLSSPSILHQFTDFILGPYEVFVLKLNGSKLNNTGDAVVLRDPTASYSATLAYPSTTQGLSWHVDLQTNAVYEATPSSGVVATASATTPTPIPIAITTVAAPVVNLVQPQVTLSEIMACPKSGQTEWIELYNAGASLEIERWLVSDAADNTRVLTGTLPASGFTVFSWPNSMLNNTGDTVVITTNLGVTIDQARYTTCKSGASLSQTGGEWLPSQPTPNEQNIFIQEETAAQEKEKTAVANTSVEKQTIPIDTEASGAILGITATTQQPYPYSLRTVVNTTFATPSAAVIPSQNSKETTQPSSKQPTSGGILGGLLLVISSLYAREKP